MKPSAGVAPSERASCFYRLNSQRDFGIKLKEYDNLYLNERTMLNEIESTLFRLLAREIEVADFEQWVYAHSDLEQALGPDTYVDLISLDYRSSSALSEAEQVLKQQVDWGKYYEWRLRRILQRIVDRPEGVHRDIEQCYDLYCDGYGFLDVLGLAYGLCVASPPPPYRADSWKDLEPAEQDDLLDSFYPGVRDKALEVLGWLDSGTIVLTGHSGDHRGIQYDDHRPSAPAESTDHKPSVLTKPWWKFW